MTSIRWFVLSVAVALASVACQAQQKFPLRSGEWTATVSNPTNPGGPPTTMLYCMNDQTWSKALNGNPSCTLRAITINSGGGSYSMSCNGRTYQVTGRFQLIFDGLAHMISTGTLEMTMNGKTTQMSSKSDFRWKGPICNPNVDMNLKDRGRAPQ
ncbi:MAG TPA: DUF3617 family protein [Terracidiphilus sp.]|jgi:hypothetical protein